jgi:spore germination protein YaaH
MRDVSVFWFTATPASTVEEQSPSTPDDPVLEEAIGTLQAAGLRVYVTVTDQDFTAASMAALLTDRDRRKALVGSLATTAAEIGADGVDIDFEHMNFGSAADKATVKRWFPVFLRQLDSRLERTMRRLTVTVPARTGRRDPSWSVFGYAAIAAEVDRARVMTYDFHTRSSEPGPIAPLDWVADVARYAGATFGRKASLGMPAYGYNWAVRTLVGPCSGIAVQNTSGSTRDFVALAQLRGASVEYRPDVAGYTYTYVYDDPSSDCQTKRRVWFEDVRSVRAKLPLLRRYGLGSIAIWQLGGERSATWRVLRDYATP